MKPLNVTLSIAAGLLGGTAAPYLLSVKPVHAQAQVLAPGNCRSGRFSVSQ